MIVACRKTKTNIDQPNLHNFLNLGEPLHHDTHQDVRTFYSYANYKALIRAQMRVLNKPK